MHKNKSHSFLFLFCLLGDDRRKRLIVNYFSTNLRQEIKLPNDEMIRINYVNNCLYKDHSKVGSSKGKKNNEDYGRGIMRGLTTRNNNNSMY